MVQKIALEEHFLAPGYEGYWRSTIGNVDPKLASNLLARLTDFGEMRLKSMDEAGIARSVLAIAGPGVQSEHDVAAATRAARAANDFLAGEVQKRPDRYSGFAHLAMQDARGAADELERCMRDLKFCGAMINGHTNGQYLDHPSLYAFWERAEALSAPIYIHPTDPIAPSPALEGVAGLRRATWEWGFETGSHALRLVFSGHFDRFPGAKVMLGHLG
jgi:2,3-dihydroxybenzoate decarboxylase